MFSLPLLLCPFELPSHLDLSPFCLSLENRILKDNNKIESDKTKTNTSEEEKKETEGKRPRKDMKHLTQSPLVWTLKTH